MEKVFVVLVLIVLQIALCYQSNDDRFRNIEGKLEILTERVDLLTDAIKANHDPRNCPQYEDIPDDLTEDFPTLLPLEARRELTFNGEEVLISLKYWAQHIEKVHTIMWRDGETYRELQPTITFNTLLPLGVAKTQIMIPVGNTTSVNLWLSSNVDTLEFRFNTSLATLEVQTCIPLPIFRKFPVGDIVYEPGQDTTFHLEVPPKHSSADGKDYYINVQVQPFLTDLDKDDTWSAVEDEDFAKETVVETALTIQRMTVLLKTSEFRAGGFVHFRVNDGKRSGDLVRTVIRQITIILRPTDQSGPFPEGYLNFLKYPTGELALNGTELQACEVLGDFPCYIGCTVMGTDITGLRIYQILQSGEREAITGHGIQSLNTVSQRSLWFQTTENSGPGIVRFQCEASNEEGVTKIRDINVCFYVAARIDHNLTDYTRINESVVELTCAATGSPTSSVRFNLNGDQKDPDEVQYTSDHVIARKLAVVPQDRYSVWFYGYSCDTKQHVPDGTWHDDYYEYSIFLTDDTDAEGTVQNSIH